ncbi:unnamed protein product [Leptosia nina]|uniref:Meckelin n=1 Tax=Leptosia nina TaxID=320188 RepID=A0AAV1JW50_9NEOP
MLCLLFLMVFRVVGIKTPGSCSGGQFYDSNTMECRSCNANVSMVPALDGFGCTCAADSIPKGISSCKQCNATELISADGTTCVPRRCQKSGSRVVCRRCPNDYIAVTQNFDGSPMKEVTCFKCHRGYKVANNKCVKCEECACARYEVAVSGKCLPKKYVMERPKYSENKLHPSALLDIVKLEYLCTQSDIRACHALSRECVRYYYPSDLAGPCRIWIQQNLTKLADLPQLNLDYKNKNNIINLKHGQDTLLIGTASYSPSGALKLLGDEKQSIFPCLPPLNIRVGQRCSFKCTKNITDIDWANGKIYELYLPSNTYKPLPIKIYKPDSNSVQKASWPTSKFSRFFLIDNILSTATNMTTVRYLSKLIVTLQIERKSINSLTLNIRTEVFYAIKSPLSDVITTQLIVENEMPSAGVLRGIEIWGGILSALLCLYALVQWRAVVRRGGLQVSIIPLLAAALADGLYCATFFSTLHALAGEAGTLGITLPLSQIEEDAIKAIVFSVVALKAIKVIWINRNHCNCDIFFIDWTIYNPSIADSYNTKSKWRAILLAKEWMECQTKRRTTPLATNISAILVIYVLDMHQYIPKSDGYTWVVAVIVWWSTYIANYTIKWAMYRFVSPPTALLKVCRGVDISLLVFQEEFYAHYVHGRNEEIDGTMKVLGPMASCRIVCATQALDGLSWVANERTLLEKLLDVELTNREGSNISTLLYDIDDDTPSCLAVTWWGEEHTLATFEAMVFGCVLLATREILVAASVTIFVWQAMKQVRLWFSYRNLTQKTGIEI